MNNRVNGAKLWIRRRWRLTPPLNPLYGFTPGARQWPALKPGGSGIVNPPPARSFVLLSCGRKCPFGIPRGSKSRLNIKNDTGWIGTLSPRTFSPINLRFYGPRRIRNLEARATNGTKYRRRDRRPPRIDSRLSFRGRMILIVGAILYFSLSDYYRTLL